jgi:hypothetical protein
MPELSSFDAGAPPRELAPVSGPERVLLLDVLRGLAMFVVLWSNLNDWYGTTDPVTSLQHALAWTQDWLVESRFYSLLAFLFGIGFAIQLTRAELRGVDVRAMFCRRMAVLLGIGIVHGMLIWRGDILTAYALVGLLLVFFRRLSPRALVVWAAALLVVSPYVVRAVVIGFGVTYPRPPDTQQQVDAIYAHGTFTQIMSMGARGYLFWYRRWPLTVFPPFLALFLLGLAVDGRTPTAHPDSYCLHGGNRGPWVPVCTSAGLVAAGEDASAALGCTVPRPDLSAHCNGNDLAPDDVEQLLCVYGGDGPAGFNSSMGATAPTARCGRAYVAHNIPDAVADFGDAVLPLRIRPVRPVGV